MSLNRDECKILNVYRSKNPIIHQYTLNGVPLESVSHHPYLGIELSSNLNWSFHAENIVGKAFILVSSDVIFIPVQKVLKVRPTSPSFVLVWNMPVACGTHILKNTVKILKEFSSEPPDLWKAAMCGNPVPSQTFWTIWTGTQNRTVTQNCATYYHVQNSEQ